MFASALVTGGASGIGAETVALLRALGTHVQVLDLADGHDVTDEEMWSRVGAVDAAFLNAGVMTGESDLARVSYADYRRTVSVNIDGVVLGVRRMAHLMEAGGTIVATASLAGLTPMPEDPIYSLTKHAVVGFVRSVAPQLAERGIRINAVCPATADTPIVDAAWRAVIDERRYPLLDPATVAEAMLEVAQSAETGRAWVVQVGRDPIPYEFRGVPGPG